MISRVAPAVVNIATEGRVMVQTNPLLNDPFFQRFFSLPEQSQQPRERRTESLGSGVIIDADKGYIVTNHHVIDKSDQVTVTLNDGRQFKANIIGSDPEADVAVIQISGQGLTALALANSDTLQVGDFVVAIGNPFGLGQTVTSGIVSALGRSGLGIEGYEDFIQTDASINPGNSGGALVNLRGHLIGINTAILAPTGGNIGISFAIPVNMVKQLVDQLLQYGRVDRGQLGVTVQDLNPQLARAFGIDTVQGALITQVSPDSAAASAGLRLGDVVTAVNGRQIRDAAGLRNAIGLLRVGDTITLDLLRSGQPLRLSARISNQSL
jgi:serine protease Do/serine protease DegQ